MRPPIFRRLVVLALLSLFLVLDASAQEKVTQPMRRFGTAAFRHGSRIQSLLFLPGGKLAAAGGNDPVRIWDVETGKAERTFPDSWIQALAYDANDKHLVAAGALRAIRIHGLGAEVKLKLENAPAGVHAIALSPDAKHLLAGCQNGQLVHIPFDGSLNPLTKIDAHSAEINAVAWTPDGQTAVSASADRTIRVWKLDGKKLTALRTIKTPAPVRAMLVGPQGLSIYEGGDDGIIRVHELATGNVQFALEGHRDIVQSLALVGTMLVSGSYDGEIRIWDTSAQKVHVRTIQRGFGDDDALAVSADGKLIAVGGDNGIIRLFDVETGKERRVAEGPRAGLARCIRTPTMIASLSRNGEVTMWDPASGQVRASWPTRITPRVQQEFTFAAHPDGNLLATGTSTEPALELWDAAGKSLGTLPLPAGEHALATAFSPSGKLLGIGYRSGLVQLLDWPERKVKQTLRAAGSVTALAFSADSPVVAAACESQVQLFDVPTGQDLRKIGSKENLPATAMPRLADIAFSPDGRTLALASYDGVVRLVDWTTGKHLLDCEGHTSAVYSIAFAPDGRTFATAGHDKTVRIWETFVGRSLAVCSVHAGPATGVLFSSDGRTAYSASADTTMAAWDATCSRSGDSLGSKELSDDEFRSAWQELASDDPLIGQKALWRICAAPNAAGKIAKSVYLVDPARVDHLFAELDSEDFTVREKATQELKRNGRWMEGRYEIALRDPPTIEVKRRVEWLIDLLRVKDALTLKQERLRLHRAFTILEQLADEPSRRALEDLLKGAPEADLQKEAERSLARLRRRDS